MFLIIVTGNFCMHITVNSLNVSCLNAFNICINAVTKWCYKTCTCNNNTIILNLSDFLRLFCKNYTGIITTESKVISHYVVKFFFLLNIRHKVKLACFFLKNFKVFLRITDCRRYCIGCKCLN